MRPLLIRELGKRGLLTYASIPISFTVDTIYRVDVLDTGLGGLCLVEEKVDQPYLKDYDRTGSDGTPESPLYWPELFDISSWGIFLAYDEDMPVGGATIALHSPDVNMLEGRDGLAVLWDIRVRPDRRGEGIGTKLFRHSENWAKEQGCRQLKIETQNVNVPACRFYSRQGCTLGGIYRFGYAGRLNVAHEVMLLWYLDL